MNWRRARSWLKSGLAALLLVGVAQIGAPAAWAQEKENTVAGQVLGVSQNARTIQVEVGQKVEMITFDDKTQGMQHIKPGEAAIIEFERVGNVRVARVVKPRLVKLPAGTSEISNDEVAKLVALGPEKGNYLLVDSRPPARYEEGHVPTAVSIPVPRLEKTKEALLPANKDTLLIFYCGGPT